MRELTSSDLIKGLIIGGILLWIFTRKNESQPINELQQAQIGVHNWKSLNNIPNFDDVYSKMIQPVAVSQPIVQNVEQDSQAIQQTEKVSSTATEYKNEEKWKIMRDTNGDISEISVSRDAKVDGGK